MTSNDSNDSNARTNHTAQPQPQDRVVIFGAGGHAKVVADILGCSGRDVAGFIDSLNPARKGETFFGHLVLGGADELPLLLAEGFVQAIVAFGDNRRRLDAGALLVAQGFTLVSAIHPSAIVAGDVRIGIGTVVAAGAVVNPSAVIGSGVIINTRASVDHDCVVEDGASVGPGACLAGNVRLGRCAFVGIGAALIENTSVGAGALVAAGAVVVRDVQPDETVMGVPATVRPRRRTK